MSALWAASSARSALGRATRPPTSSRSTRSREKSREAEQWGATEVCIQGGLPRDLPPFYYRDILRAVKSATPKMHAHAFSPMEMVYGVELTGMPIREYLLMLKENGLDTLPGTAAEILDDSVRTVLSRNKLSDGAVVRGDRDGTRVRHPQHLDHDVRPHARRRSTG